MEKRRGERKKAKIRIGLSSISGAGKTVSALLIAYGITEDWSKIAVIDTENNSAELYINRTLKTTGQTIGEFDVVNLAPPFSPERYIEAIKLCEDDSNIEIIIIDSISHEWEGKGGVIQLADEIGGGFNQAWKQLTPRHDAFKQAVLQSRCHMITTVRRKQDYILVEAENSKGKMVQKPIKAGFKEITREGWEYELTLNLELDLTHMASVSKDRTELFMDNPPFIPSIETGRMIKDWAELGMDPAELIREAVSKLENCHSVEDLKMFKETLPEYVIKSELFQKAGKKRHEMITKLAPQS